jgi:hypothetical protein
MNKYIIFLFGLILFSGFFEWYLPYIFLAFLSLTSLFFILINRTIRIYRLNFVDYLFFIWPFLIFLTWCYGVFRGFYNGNSIDYIFSNFAGLSLYPFFYIFFIYNINFYAFYSLLYYLGLSFSVYSIFLFFNTFFSAGISYSEGFSHGRVLMSSCITYIAPFICLLIVRFISKEKIIYFKFLNKHYFLSFLFFSFALLVPAASKGYALGYVFFIFVFTIFSLKYIQKRGMIFYIFVLFLCILNVLAYIHYDFFYQSFTFENVSNQVRVIQVSHILKDINFWGNGLGATLANFFSRDSTGYGFELTYLNIIHKLGIFSIPLFLSYLITLLYSFKFLFKHSRQEHGALLLGSMFYLIPGIGNPILLAPSLVFLHCAVLYFIFKIKLSISSSL